MPHRLKEIITLLKISNTLYICDQEITQKQKGTFLSIYNVILHGAEFEPANPLFKAKLELILLCYIIPILLAVMASASLKQSLELQEAEDWFSWPENHAQEPLCMLGF